METEFYGNDGSGISAKNAEVRVGTGVNREASPGDKPGVSCQIFRFLIGLRPCRRPPIGEYVFIDFQDFLEIIQYFNKISHKKYGELIRCGFNISSMSRIHIRTSRMQVLSLDYIWE